jgi:hypothetical protein
MVSFRAPCLRQSGFDRLQFVGIMPVLSRGRNLAFASSSFAVDPPRTADDCQLEGWQAPVLALGLSAPRGSTGDIGCLERPIWAGVPEDHRVSGAGRWCDGAEPVVAGGLD